MEKDVTEVGETDEKKYGVIPEDEFVVYGVVRLCFPPILLYQPLSVSRCILLLFVFLT